jgi:hypothetical protein
MRQAFSLLFSPNQNQVNSQTLKDQSFQMNQQINKKQILKKQANSYLKYLEYFKTKSDEETAIDAIFK